MHGKCYKTLVCNIHLFAPDGLQRRIAFVRTSMSHFLEHTYFMGIQGILRVFIVRKSWWDQNLRICISQAIWGIELQTSYSKQYIWIVPVLSCEIWILCPLVLSFAETAFQRSWRTNSDYRSWELEKQYKKSKGVRRFLSNCLRPSRHRVQMCEYSGFAWFSKIWGIRFQWFLYIVGYHFQHPFLIVFW